jgi:hypothetical protein
VPPIIQITNYIRQLYFATHLVISKLQTNTALEA